MYSFAVTIVVRDHFIRRQQLLNAPGNFMEANNYIVDVFLHFNTEQKRSK